MQGAAQVTKWSSDLPAVSNGAAADEHARRPEEPEGEGMKGEHGRAQKLTAELVGETASEGEDGVDDGMRRRPAAGVGRDGAIRRRGAFPAIELRPGGARTTRRISQAHQFLAGQRETAAR